MLFLMSAPKYSPKGENNGKLGRASERARTEEMTDFEMDRKVFWERISQIERNNKSLWEYIKGQLLKVTDILYPPCPNFPD